MSKLAMSSTTLAPSLIKDAMDAQSGRFEFFKQTLTLGSAGLAGIAALFSDQTRIPTNIWLKFAVTVAGLALLFIVAAAAMGLSAYANLLTALAREANPTLATGKSRKPSSTYSSGVVSHAKIIIVALFVTWSSMTGFAALRLFASDRSATAETALTAAKAFVSKATGQTPESLFLTRLAADTDAFVITYYSQAVPSETNVRVSKKDGSIILLTQEKKFSSSAAEGK